MAVLKPKRGEVWWVNFDPAQGTEITKIRPSVIVSNDSANQYLERVQVIPLTSNVAKVYPSECVVNIKQQPAKAMADQIRTVSSARCNKRIGTLSDTDMSLVEQAIKIQLGL